MSLKFIQEDHQVYSKSIRRFQHRMTRHIYKRIKLAIGGMSKTPHFKTFFKANRMWQLKIVICLTHPRRQFSWSIFWDKFV